MSDFDRDEANRFWDEMHSHGPDVDTQRDPDLLEVVCHPGMPPWFNRYVAHVQENAFRDGIRRCGPLDGKKILEVGCGSGRWSRRMASLGADVLATDLSSVVIERNRAAMPQIGFEAGDFLELDLPDGGFDGVVSVTVIQHFPPDAQEKAAARIGSLLRPGGFALLLENTKDRGAHVFGRDLADWRSLMAGNGLRLAWARGYEYDYPIRAAGRLAHLIRKAMPSKQASDAARTEAPEQLAGDMFSGGHQLEKAVLYGPAVLAAYPLEPLSAALLPGSMATHAAMVFRKG